MVEKKVAEDMENKLDIPRLLSRFKRLLDYKYSEVMEHERAFLLFILEMGSFVDSCEENIEEKSALAKACIKYFKDVNEHSLLMHRDISYKSSFFYAQNTFNLISQGVYNKPIERARQRIENVIQSMDLIPKRSKKYKEARSLIEKCNTLLTEWGQKAE